jgi:hypothetical protein
MYTTSPSSKLLPTRLFESWTATELKMRHALGDTREDNEAVLVQKGSRILESYKYIVVSYTR